MNLADELKKLHQLYEQGALNEAEFSAAKARILDSASATTSTSDVATGRTLARLARARHDRWIGGVCGGLAELSQLPAWSWRMLFVFALLLHGLGLLMYVLLWIFVPIQRDTLLTITDKTALTRPLP